MTTAATLEPSKLPVLKDKVTTIRALMETNKNAFVAALPRHMNADRLIRVALTSFNLTPDLLDCTPRSLLGAVIQCAQLGLEPGVLGLAYLIPYGKDVQLVVGYKGLIQLARRSGEISTVTAHEVRVGDRFHYQYGLDPELVHVPSENAEREKAPITHFYAVVKLKDGGAQFEVMTRAQIDAHRDRYSRAAKKGPWVTEYPEMGKKTVLRRVLKLSPASIEIQQAVDLDERAELQLPQHLGELSGLPPEDEPSKLDQLTATLRGKKPEPGPDDTERLLLASMCEQLEAKVGDLARIADIKRGFGIDRAETASLDLLVAYREALEGVVGQAVGQ